MHEDNGSVLKAFRHFAGRANKQSSNQFEAAPVEVVITTRDVLRSQMLNEGIPKGWTKGTIQIATRTGKESMQGYSKGNIAVHKGAGGSGWVITHAPSGYAMVKGLVTQEAATTIADAIIEKFPEFVKAADAKTAERLAKKYGRDIMQVVNTLKATVNKKKPSARDIARQSQQDAEAEEAKKYFDKIGDTYDKLQLQFIRYAEAANLSLEFKYLPYQSTDKEKEKRQAALYSAHHILRGVQINVNGGRKGLHTKKHMNDTESSIKKLNAALASLKKLGMDVSKTPEKMQTYLVTYDISKGAYYKNIGNAGPKSDGIIIDAASAYEATKKVGDEININSFYLKAEVMK